MKETELRKFATCGLCKKKVLQSGLPLFYRLTVERFGIKMDAVNRQAGLEMMLGGSAFVAQAMGPDEDMAEPMMEPLSIAICEKCAMTDLCVAEIAERAK